MIIWIDAQLSPDLAQWISGTFEIKACSIKSAGLRDAEDEKIFMAARHAKAILMTKDNDFLTILERHGAPPQILWVTCGNTSNAQLKKILKSSLPQAIRMLKAGEALIEISDL